MIIKTDIKINPCVCGNSTVKLPSGYETQSVNLHSFYKEDNPQKYYKVWCISCAREGTYAMYQDSAVENWNQENPRKGIVNMDSIPENLIEQIAEKMWDEQFNAGEPNPISFYSGKMPEERAKILNYAVLALNAFGALGFQPPRKKEFETHKNFNVGEAFDLIDKGLKEWESAPALQPMSTAPRDGTPFIIPDTIGTTICWYDELKDPHIWVCVDTKQDDKLNGFHKDQPPQGWCPLPEFE